MLALKSGLPKNISTREKFPPRLQGLSSYLRRPKSLSAQYQRELQRHELQPGSTTSESSSLQFDWDLFTIAQEDSLVISLAVYDQFDSENHDLRHDYPKLEIAERVKLRVLPHIFHFRMAVLVSKTMGAMNETHKPVYPLFEKPSSVYSLFSCSGCYLEGSNTSW